jgi:hypothetical protein
VVTDPDAAGHTASTEAAAAADLDPGLALLGLLGRLPGSYAGRGTDVADGEFDATATVAAVAGGAAVRLSVAIAGPPPYAEHGLLGRGESGAPQYVTVSTNAPFLRVFALRRTETGATGTGVGYARAVFGWGGPVEHEAGFREEFTVTVHADGDLGLAWAWGQPGDKFAPRSGVRLTST